MKISREQAEADVAKFLNELGKKGWLVSTQYDAKSFRLRPKPTPRGVSS